MLDHKAKKSLGQNFLTAQSVVKDIVRAGDILTGDTILEIGPGKGVLTRALLATGATVIAVEKDDSLFAYLQKIFALEIAEKKFVLYNGDILEMLPTILLPSNYKLIANIPYNITGKIISDFLAAENKPNQMVLMVQYEVAARIAARDGKASILSTAVRAYGKPKLIKRVSAGSFFPKPRVDSAVLQISDISNTFFKENNMPEKTFFKVLKAGFAHKRKKLTSNLKEVFPLHDWGSVLVDLGLDSNTRAEDIDIIVWGKLTRVVTVSE